MKKGFQQLVLATCLSIPTVSMADPIPGTDGQDLSQLLQNLGAYFGFQIQNPPPQTGPQPYNITYTLINPNLGSITLGALLYAVGAMPINTAIPSTMSFAPSGQTSYSILNSLANKAYGSLPYNAPSNNNVSVSQLIDQQPSQNDPVAQSLLNILGTPDYTYCLDGNGNPNPSACPALSQAQVVMNIIGPIPSTSEFFMPGNGGGINPSLLSDLNTNSLLGPLMYSTQAENQSPTSSPTPTSGQQGLTSLSQAQQAANFVRYVSGLVVPIGLPDKKTYDDLFSKTINTSDSSTPSLQQLQAQATLANYLSSLRVYAAQNSVGISNLYEMLAKRLPQPAPPGSSAANTPPSSQALNEFQMASWRLFNPNTGQNDSTWTQSINESSPATVQKEIAVLLAEINYQLYLSRMQDERQLLTLSIILLQSSRGGAKPSLTPTPN